MNSTRNQKLFSHFYRKLFLKAAKKLRDKGYIPIELSLSDEESWYSSPSQNDDFVLFEKEKVAEQLSDLWSSSGLVELSSLVPEFMHLSDNLEFDYIYNSEIPPFIYVMY